MALHHGLTNLCRNQSARSSMVPSILPNQLENLSTGPTCFETGESLPQHVLGSGTMYWTCRERDANILGLNALQSRSV